MTIRKLVGYWFAIGAAGAVGAAATADWNDSMLIGNQQALVHKLYCMSTDW